MDEYGKNGSWMYALPVVVMKYITPATQPPARVRPEVAFTVVGLMAVPTVYWHRNCSTVMQPLVNATGAGSVASSSGGGGGAAVKPADTEVGTSSWEVLEGAT